MSTSPRLFVLALAAGLAWPAGAAAGTVTGVSVSGGATRTGAQISVTVTGTNPCGAANIDYGDGTAITYAITELPTTQTHAYANPGTFTITAKGEGNCDGQATTRITVTGTPSAPPRPAPPAPAPAAQITAVEFAPTPAIARKPVAMSVSGSGDCTFNVSFGDGNEQDVRGRLPQRISHTYTVADVYTVIMNPSAPCTGRFTQKLQVVAQQTQPPPPPAALTGIDVVPSTATINSRVTLTLKGSGQCRVSVYFGDDVMQTYDVMLPRNIAHAWSQPGHYQIEAWTEDACPGYVVGQVDIR